MSAMSKIKNLDVNSARGQRNVTEGLTTDEGKRHLIGFDFNIHAPLDSVLFANYTLNNANGEINIPNLIIAEQVRFPEGANFIGLQCGILNVEFDTGLNDLVLSPVVNLPITMTPNNVTLTPPNAPSGHGVTINVIMVSFYQEVNGVQYSLKNEEYNVLHIVDVT